MSENRKKILIIDDSKLVHEVYGSQLMKAGFEVKSADKLSSGLTMLKNGGVDLVLLDLTLPDSQGIETFNKVYSEIPNVPIVMLTGNDDENIAISAVKEGAQDYIVKDQIDTPSFIRSVYYAIERKQAEEKLKKLTKDLEVANKELARSNADLQQFAYIASHDLQEPLRKVISFSDRINKKCSTIIDNESKDYLIRMQNAAKRMEQLINDLLAYSRVTRETQEFKMVNLNSVIKDILEDLEVSITRSKAKIEIKNLPNVNADETQMHQLFQNLISNAIKFSKKDVPPHIKIESKKEGGFIYVSIEDNGIGFDESYLDRIFSPFQRLQGRLEYEGSGIGLAICEKIVLHHKGKITARSQEGQGSTFIVSLPTV